MKEFGDTLPPIGHVKFCTERPAACEGHGAAETRPAVTKARWAELDRINRAVNDQVRPTTDKALYGVEERWAYPSGAGDCEDYVLLKQKMLIAKGWPEDALLITVVRDRKGEGHAVLTVSTDRGDLILDNKTDKIRLWSDAPYRFLKRQSREHPRQWVALDRRTASIRTRLFGGLGH